MSLKRSLSDSALNTVSRAAKRQEAFDASPSDAQLASAGPPAHADKSVEVLATFIQNNTPRYERELAQLWAVNFLQDLVARCYLPQMSKEQITELVLSNTDIADLVHQAVDAGRQGHPDMVTLVDRESSCLTSSRPH